MKVVAVVIDGQNTQIRVPEDDPRPAVKKRDVETTGSVPNKKRSPAPSTARVRTK